VGRKRTPSDCFIFGDFAHWVTANLIKIDKMDVVSLPRQFS